MSDTINKAFEEFMIELFGSVPEDIASQKVNRSEYMEKMKKVQEKYGLKQGHPDFVGWLFTLIGRSPIIIEDDKEGASKNESTEA